MKRLLSVCAVVCCFLFAAAVVPANINADCADSGWTFVNDGPCPIIITVTPTGDCIGADLSFTVPAQDRIRHREICCIKEVKIQVGDPCFGVDDGWPVYCRANTICDLPAPFNAVSVGECGVKLY